MVKAEFGVMFLLIGGLNACSPVHAPAPKPRPVEVAGLTLWSGAEDWATVSPDSRFVAFVDWDTGNLAARDLASDTTYALTHKAGWDRDRSWAEGPLVFSPDGRQIAYSYANASAGNPYRYELRVKRMSDTLQQVLDSVPSDAPALTVLDWHPDTGILYGNQHADESSEIRLVATDGSAPRILKRHAAGSPMPHSGVITPDGRTIFYLFGNTLRAISSAGENDRSLGLDVETLLGWTDNGRDLVYNGRRGNVTGNFRIRIANGAPTGEPILVQRTHPHVRPAGDADGTIYFLESMQVPRVLLADVDMIGGNIMTSTRAITYPMDGIASNPTWSPSGSRMAYTVKPSNRPVFAVMVADMSGESRELARVDAGLITALDWASDGGSLIIAARTNSRESSWVGRIDAITGRVDRLIMHPALAAATGPGGRVAYLRAALANDSTTHIMVLERGSETPRSIASFAVGESPRSISISPDGDSVAIIKMVANRSATEVQLVPVKGGSVRTVARLERPSSFEINLGSVPWPPDGRRMLLLARSEGKNRFVSIDVGSGSIVSLEPPLGPGPRRHPAIHPDGRRLLYVDGLNSEDLKAMAGSRK